MNKTFPEEFLLKKVVVNQESGTFGWRKEDALDFLNSPSADNFAFFGGDVMRFNEDRKFYENTYDSWFLNRGGPLEDFKIFCIKSKKKAIEYISNYKADDNIVFVLVASSEVTAGL